MGPNRTRMCNLRPARLAAPSIYPASLTCVPSSLLSLIIRAPLLRLIRNGAPLMYIRSCVYRDFPYFEPVALYLFLTTFRREGALTLMTEPTFADKKMLSNDISVNDGAVAF